MTAVQAGYIASRQPSPGQHHGTAGVSHAKTIDTTPAPLELLPYTEALRRTSLIATACPPTDAPRTGRSAPGNLRRDPSHGPRGIGDLAASISSGAADGASQSCRQIQLKDHETLHTYSLPGIVMCVRNTLLSADPRGLLVYGRSPGNRPHAASGAFGGGFVLLSDALRDAPAVADRDALVFGPGPDTAAALAA